MPHWENKHDGLMHAIRLLEATTDGIGQTELALKLGCSESTAKRYLREMREKYGAYEVVEGSGKYSIPRNTNLANLRLNAREALMMYLGLRRLIRQFNQVPFFMITALEKIIPLLQREDLVHNLTEAADQLRVKRQAPDSAELVWDRLILGWIEKRVLKITYLGASADEGKPSVHLCEPYLFEPQLSGDGVYCIVYSLTRNGEPVNELRTLKVDRIHHVEVKLQRFTPRGELSIQKLLEKAWHIYYGDTVQRVTLRFTPDKARRALESVYMDSEMKELQPDGSLLWSVEVTATLELEHWILGWGAGVEVLEPLSLREKICDELRRAFELYTNNENR